MNAPSPIARKYLIEDLAAEKAELAACEDGSWPRDINDRCRYSPPYTADTPAKVRKYVAKLCRTEITYLEAKLSLS